MPSEIQKNSENKDHCNTFGGRLRKCRTDKHLSQSDLAAMLGYKHNGPVSTMESGKTSPDLAILQRLAECLNVDLHWLITGQPTPNTIRIVTTLEPCVLEFLRELNQQILHIGNLLVRLEMSQRLRGEDNRAEIEEKTKARDRLTEQYARIWDAMKNAGRL